VKVSYFLIPIVIDLLFFWASIFDELHVTLHKSNNTVHEVVFKFGYPLTQLKVCVRMQLKQQPCDVFINLFHVAVNSNAPQRGNSESVSVAPLAPVEGAVAVLVAFLLKL
jgi:hypothetical protein